MRKLGAEDGIYACSWPEIGPRIWFWEISLRVCEFEQLEQLEDLDPGVEFTVLHRSGCADTPSLSH